MEDLHGTHARTRDMSVKCLHTDSSLDPCILCADFTERARGSYLKLVLVR